MTTRQAEMGWPKAQRRPPANLNGMPGKSRAEISERTGTVMSRGIEKARGRRAYCGGCTYTKVLIWPLRFFLVSRVLAAMALLDYCH